MPSPGHLFFAAFVCTIGIRSSFCTSVTYESGESGFSCESDKSFRLNTQYSWQTQPQVKVKCPKDPKIVGAGVKFVEHVFGNGEDVVDKEVYRSVGEQSPFSLSREPNQMKFEDRIGEPKTETFNLGLEVTATCDIFFGIECKKKICFADANSDGLISFPDEIQFSIEDCPTPNHCDNPRRTFYTENSLLSNGDKEVNMICPDDANVTKPVLVLLDRGIDLDVVPTKGHEADHAVYAIKYGTMIAPKMKYKPKFLVKLREITLKKAGKESKFQIGKTKGVEKYAPHQLYFEATCRKDNKECVCSDLDCFPKKSDQDTADDIEMPKSIVFAKKHCKCSSVCHPKNRQSVQGYKINQQAAVYVTCQDGSLPLSDDLSIELHEDTAVDDSTGTKVNGFTQPAEKRKRRSRTYYSFPVVNSITTKTMTSDFNFYFRIGGKCNTLVNGVCNFFAYVCSIVHDDELTLKIDPNVVLDRVDIFSCTGASKSKGKAKSSGKQ